MSSYNQRQFQRILECINAYQEQVISLKKCISNLKGLIASLELSEDTLRKKLQTKWGILEEVYAVVLDQDQVAFSSSQKILIQKALEDIKNEAINASVVA